MTGSLQEKRGVYHCVLNFRDSDGKRKQKWVSTNLPIKGNKRKAEQILQELIAKHDGTVLLDSDKALVCDFISEWVERNRPSIQSTTYCGYKHVLDSHIYPYFKNMGITIYQIAPIHIDRYIQCKLAEGLSPNTVLKHCYIIRSALEVARKQRFIRENVVDAVDKPSKRKYTPTFYNKEEINELLTAARGTALETPVFLAAFFGLRRSEIVGLRWESIDFSERQITIKHKAVRLTLDGKREYVFTDNLKTASSYRSLPLDQSMYDYLMSVRERTIENRHIYGHDYRTEFESFVCVRDTGTLMTPGSISEAFPRLLQANGLKHIRFHDLRHSCASMLLSLGYSMKEIQDWLGHADYLTTANTYAHIEQGSKRNMIGDIGNILHI